MTRINTSVSSLVAQNTLGRSNAALEQALTRLSTGLRINTGKDDPAGLIASENLRSDITSIKRAIGNTDRANQVIATADSALGQVSSLLNDIRGLITESANSGALSAEQITANQLQIDSSLEALNRIAQTVTFQGRKLLDGSLDFATSATANFNRLSGLQINQANLGSTGAINVAINVTTAAQKASIQTEVDLASAGAQGTVAVDLSTVDAGVKSTTGAIDLTSFGDDGAGGTFALGASDGSITVRAAAAGTTHDGVAVTFAEDAGLNNGEVQVSFDSVNNTIVVRGKDVVDAAAFQAAFSTLSDFEVVTADGTGAFSFDFAAATLSDLNALPVELDNGRVAAGTLTVETVDNTDAFNGVAVKVRGDNSLIGTGIKVVAELTSDGTELRFRVNTDPNLGSLITASDFTDALEEAGLDDRFAIDGLTGGSLAGSVVSTTYQSLGAVADGTDSTSGLLADLVFELSGRSGSEVFSFQTGTSGTTIANAINLVSDAVGVTAAFDVSTGALTLTSKEYGDAAFVNVKVISEDTSVGTFTTNFGGTTRANGADVVATVNGISAKGDGNSLSLSSSTLSLKTSVDAGFAGSVTFSVTGGGALFQLGPEVVSNQQARIGITSVNTARLGGASGSLYQLASGGTADLLSDPTSAALIIDEAITQITSLRGRLGAFQRTSLETNRNTLSDTLVNLTEAESQIRDADFAAETAALTRAQILVQSGTTVLQIANQSPQNVLALLR